MQVGSKQTVSGKTGAIHTMTRAPCDLCEHPLLTVPVVLLQVFMEALSTINAKCEMTDQLVCWAGQQSLKRTFASIPSAVRVRTRRSYPIYSNSAW
jgi:hypothetical protein